MKCEHCGKDIPLDEQQFLEIDGIAVPYPFCDSCQAEMDRRMELYGPRNKPKKEAK